MELKVLGQEKIGKIKFTGIEGGFGPGKKAMLVPDIAKIHGRRVAKVNELINENIKQFQVGVDLIDLKSAVRQKDSEKVAFLKDIGFSQNKINASSHIYVLSERGYLKLLKIMDDDKAWDIYNDIVDNYFNMRVAIKENKPKIVEPSRLAIMHENAQTRKANAFLKLVATAPNESAKSMAWGKAYEELTGETYLNKMTKKTYTATEIAKKFNTTSAMVGRIANSLGLKAEKKEPFENEYGIWIKDTAKYVKGKPVDNWYYYEPALKPIKEELKKRGK